VRQNQRQQRSAAGCVAGPGVWCLVAPVALVKLPRLKDSGEHLPPPRACARAAQPRRLPAPVRPTTRPWLYLISTSTVVACWLVVGNLRVSARWRATRWRDAAFAGPAAVWPGWWPPLFLPGGVDDSAVSCCGQAGRCNHPLGPAIIPSRRPQPSDIYCCAQSWHRLPWEHRKKAPARWPGTPAGGMGNVRSWPPALETCFHSWRMFRVSRTLEWISFWPLVIVRRSRFLTPCPWACRQLPAVLARRRIVACRVVGFGLPARMRAACSWLLQRYIRAPVPAGRCGQWLIPRILFCSPFKPLGVPGV